MPTRTLNVVISGDPKQLGRATKQAEGHLDKLDKSGRKTLSGLKTGMLAVGGAATAGLVVGLKKSADAAIEAEKANSRLQAQLKAVNISFAAHEKQIQKSIDALSQLSGLDDEDLGDSFTNIVRITGNVNEALKLNALAADIARAKNIDVAKAGQLVAKAYDGNVGALKRYGVSIDPVTKAQDRLKASNKDATTEQIRAAKEADKQATAQKALAEAQKTFSGQAKAYGETTAGAVDRSKVAFENLGETIGSHVTPIIARVAEGFTTLVRQMTLGEGPGGRVRAVLEGIGTSAASVYGTIRNLVSGFQQGDSGARALAAGLGAVAAAFVTFKTLSTIVAGVTALRAAWVGLTAAIAANPIGALAVVIGAVVGALAVMSINTRSASAASRDLNDALRAQADALRAVRDIDIDVAQRKANLASANVSVEQAEKRLHDLRKSGKASATDIKQAEADLKQARVAATRATRDVGDAEEDERRKREDANKATSTAREKTRDLIAAKEIELKSVEHSIKVQEAQAARYGSTAKVSDDLRGKAKQLRTEIDKLESKTIEVKVNMVLAPGPNGQSRPGDGIGSRLRGGVTRLARRAAGSMLPAFGGGLKGARASMAPFAGAAARFGLGVVSGLRPGAITSSGNPSYHGSGEAIDVSGSAAGMMGFFRQMKSTVGGSLAELIYGPGKVGIKDGRPYNFGAALNAQHMDHVHVAYDTGAPGVGDGIGEIKSLWTRAGGSSSAQNMAAAIAMAESGGNPNISHRNSDGSIDRGLWQINSVHGAQSTFNRLGNAKAAVSISGNGRNWNPWTVFKTGAYKRFLSAAGKAPAAKGGKKGGTKTVTVKPSGPGFETEQDAAPGLTDEQQAAKDFMDKTRGPGKGTSARAPRKGLTRDQLDAIAANSTSVDDNTAAIEAANELLRTQNALIQQSLDASRAAYNVSQSQYGILAQAITDVVNGQIGGKLGLGLSGLRSPAGSVART